MNELWPLLQQLNLWDVLCLLVLGISALVGLWRGLLFEVTSLAGIVLAFLGAQWGAYIVQQMLPSDVGLLAHEQVRWVLAFLLVFLGISVSATLVSNLLRKWLRKMGLGGLDRLLGMTFGIARALVLLWVITAVVIATPLRNSQSWQQSLASPLLQQSLHTLTPLLPPTFMQWMHDSIAQQMTRQRGAMAIPIPVPAPVSVQPSTPTTPHFLPSLPASAP